jgi:hypothetical protein
MKLCSDKTKAGKSCRAAAGPGGLCYFHANPESAKRLGQIGGLKNRRFTGVDLQVPDNITTSDLCKLEVQVVRGLVSGDIPAREATALAQMFNLLHRHLPSADLEKRIALLEESAGQVSMPIDVSEAHVAENDSHESTDSPLNTSDTVSERASDNLGGPENKDEETGEAI